MVKAIPSKAEKTKYSFKFLAFVGNSYCLFKIKIFRQTRSDLYLIDFQRFGGDCLAFNEIWVEAGHHFVKNGFTLTVAPPSQNVRPQIPPLAGSNVAFQHVPLKSKTKSSI